MTPPSQGAKKKPRAKAVPNHAVIRLTFPDGCRLKVETRRDVDIATDPMKFIAWLQKEVEDWQELATTMGRCATRETEATDVE